MLVINAQPFGNLTRRTRDSQSSPWHTLTKLPDPRCDPYLIWFDLTYETVRDAQGQRKLLSQESSIDILLELPDAVMSNPSKAKSLLDELKSTFCFKPRTESLPHAHPYKFLCGSLPISKMFQLSREIAERRPKRWQRDLRFELATPRFIGGADSVAPQPQPLAVGGGAPERKKSKLTGALSWLLPAPPRPSRWSAARFRLADPSLVSSPPLVAVIDDFCNHASLGLAGQIRNIWHQGRKQYRDEADPAAAKAVLDAATDDDPGTEDYGEVESIRPPPGQIGLRPASPRTPDERHAYLRRTHERPTLSWTHGTAVLSLLARGQKHLPPGVSPDGLDALEAPRDIEFIQLPDAAVLDTSGGSLCGFALDALHRAVRLACHDDPRSVVIVNLSFGTHSGPHDGTSMFERAVLELLDRFNGREISVPMHGKGRLPVLHVVLAAGNTHLERTHASARLDANGGCKELLWMIPPDNDADSFVEIWIDDDVDAKVEIELLPPEAHQSSGRSTDSAVIPGQIKTWSDGELGLPESVLHSAVIYPRTTSKGQRGRMALIAVAPTQQRANQGQGETYRGTTDGAPKTDPTGRVIDALERVRMQAAPGCWTVRLTNRGTRPTYFHAWIQRHDAAPGRRRASKGYQGRQSYFVEEDGNPVDPRFTMSGIATASCPGRLWVVGAMDERGGIASYSAAGPDRGVGQRICGPDVVTTVDRSRNVPGRHVHGVFSGARLRLSGTSIGAAAFTRMLYHTLVSGGTPTWLTPCDPPPLPVRTAETPAMADDWMRGACQRLDNACHLAIPGMACAAEHDHCTSTLAECQKAACHVHGVPR